MPGPSVEEIEAKLTEYKAARADRVAKQEKHSADKEALNQAVAAEAASHDAWTAALAHENDVEDQFEVMVVAHEPDGQPE